MLSENSQASHSSERGGADGLGYSRLTGDAPPESLSRRGKAIDVTSWLAFGPGMVGVAKIDPLAHGGVRRAPENRQGAGPRIREVVVQQLHKRERRGAVGPRDLEAEAVGFVLHTPADRELERCADQVE